MTKLRLIKIALLIIILAEEIRNANKEINSRKKQQKSFERQLQQYLH